MFKIMESSKFGGGGLIEENNLVKKINQYIWMESTQIVALEKIWDKPIEGSTWNNAILKWTILAKTSTSLKNFQIQLQITYLSSKRVVRVNGIQKHTDLRTFGYECKFALSEEITAHIKQIGLNLEFQLYLNGKSFSELENQRPTYTPLEMKDNDKFAFLAQPIKKNKNSELKQTHQATKMPNTQFFFKQEKIKYDSHQQPFQKNFSIKQAAQSEEDKIKRTQKQLMMILKQKKKQNSGQP